MAPGHRQKTQPPPPVRGRKVGPERSPVPPDVNQYANYGRFLMYHKVLLVTDFCSSWYVDCNLKKKRVFSLKKLKNSHILCSCSVS